VVQKVLHTFYLFTSIKYLAITTLLLTSGLHHCWQRKFKKNTSYFYAVRIGISLAILSEIFIQIGYFLSRISILTRDIDIANLSVCLSVRPSVRYVPVSDKNGLTYRQRLND